MEEARGGDVLQHRGREKMDWVSDLSAVGGAITGMHRIYGGYYSVL
jgi:hypothetical protein